MDTEAKLDNFVVVVVVIWTDCAKNQAKEKWIKLKLNNDNQMKTRTKNEPPCCAAPRCKTAWAGL